MAFVYKDCNDTIAHLEEVQGQLADVAERGFLIAQGHLSRHKKTGAHRITLTKGLLDRFVNLVGPAADSVEFGHFFDNGEIDAKVKFIPGLHILRDTIRDL